MKKLLALICVGAFAGSMASAQLVGYDSWLVYDYRASIQRLNMNISAIKYSDCEYDGVANTTEKLTSYSVVADTLTGYLVIPMCSSCGVYMGASSSVGYPEAFLMVKRGGDKTYKVWKFDAWVAQGLFAPGVGARLESDCDDNNEYEWEGRPTSLKKLTQAWMSIEFEYDNKPGDIIIDPLLTEPVDHCDPLNWVTECDADRIYAPFAPYGQIEYGFLGYGNRLGDIAMTGFGKAKMNTSSPLCGDPENCFWVTSAAGSLVGWVTQVDPCINPPIWDVCSLYSLLADNPEDKDSMANGTLHGTWSVTLNEKVTLAYNDALDMCDNVPSDLVLIEKIKKGGKISDMHWLHLWHYWIYTQYDECGEPIDPCEPNGSGE